MQLYVITGVPALRDGGAHFATTLGGAHLLARDNTKSFPSVRPEVRIELVEIDTTRDSIAAILNNEGGFQSPPKRTWGLTLRGGLTELANGE